MLEEISREQLTHGIERGRNREKKKESDDWSGVRVGSLDGDGPKSARRELSEMRKGN